VQTARQTIRQKSQVPDQLVGQLGGVRQGGQVTAGDLVGAGAQTLPRDPAWNSSGKNRSSRPAIT
jgi:hypothetical protein